MWSSFFQVCLYEKNELTCTRKKFVNFHPGSFLISRRFLIPSSYLTRCLLKACINRVRSRWSMTCQDSLDFSSCFSGSLTTTHLTELEKYQCFHCQSLHCKHEIHQNHSFIYQMKSSCLTRSSFMYLKIPFLKGFIHNYVWFLLKKNTIAI